MNLTREKMSYAINSRMFKTCSMCGSTFATRAVPSKMCRVTDLSFYDKKVNNCPFCGCKELVEPVLTRGMALKVKAAAEKQRAKNKSVS